MSASPSVYQREAAEDGCRAQAGVWDSCTGGGGSAITTTEPTGWELGSTLGVGSSLLLRELPAPGFPTTYPEPDCSIS